MALGFEKMEKGSLGVKFTDRTNPMDKHAGAMVEMRGFAKAPPAAQFFGNAGREHMERYGTNARALREDRLEEPQALGEQPLLAVPGRVLARGHPEGADDLRAADQAAVLPDLGRRGRGDPRERGVREEARAREAGGGDRRHGDDDRLPEHLREQSCDQAGRLGHDPQGRREGVRAERLRAGGRRRGRAARLLLVQRAGHATKRWACARRARPASSSTPARTPTAARWW